MAISTYDELKTAVQDWAGQRTDLAPRIDDFIALVESDLNSMPDFRIMEMEATATIVIDEGSGALPDDYLEWRDLVYPGTYRTSLEYITPDRANYLYPERESGEPKHFTIIDGAIEVYPSVTADLTLLYYQNFNIDGLNASSPSNWLLTKSPNVYLFGCLAYAGAYMMDDAMEQKNRARFMEAVGKLIAADKGARYARAAIATPGPTP